MAVARDALAASPTQFSSGFSSPQTDTTLTITAAGTLLIVWVSLGSGSGLGSLVCSGVSWGGTAVTLLPNSPTTIAGKNLLYCFALLNPATGNQTISASFTGSTATCSGGIFGVSYKGTDTSTLTTAIPTADIFAPASSLAAGNLAPASPFSVTTASGDYAIAGINAENTDFPNMQIGNFLAELSNFNPNATYGDNPASGTTTQIQFQGGANNAVCGYAFHIAQGGAGGDVLMPQIWL